MLRTLYLLPCSFSILHCSAAQLHTSTLHANRAVCMALRNETEQQRAARKQAKKAAKVEKRAQREGRGDPHYGQKDCTLCSAPKDLLIRCQVADDGVWHMLCGKCWKDVSGGVVDGDEDHPHYRYGGLWKNLNKQDNQAHDDDAAQ